MAKTAPHMSSTSNHESRTAGSSLERATSNTHPWKLHVPRFAPADEVRDLLCWARHVLADVPTCNAVHLLTKRTAAQTIPSLPNFSEHPTSALSLNDFVSSFCRVLCPCTVNTANQPASYVAGISRSKQDTAEAATIRRIPVQD